jgi:hypothetical protein
VRVKRFVRERVELARACVTLNGGVELRRIESLEPDAEPRELARRKLFDGFLNVFGGGHSGNVAPARDL